jgi:uncharacterized protein
MTTAKPRIETLDVLRGFAVLGILMVNAAYFAYPWQAGANPTLAPFAAQSGPDWAAWAIKHVFFETKFISLFSMLFGVSIFLIGGERNDREAGALLRSRLFWLLLFGLAHGLLIWNGDILLTYACAGLLVALARSWSPRRLLIVGVVLFALNVLFVVGGGASLVFLPADELGAVRDEIWAPSPEALAETVATMRGGLMSATGENIANWVEFAGFGLPAYLAMTSGLMMIGLALFKLGFFEGRWSSAAYAGVILAGVAALAIISWQAVLNWRAGFPFPHSYGLGIAANWTLAPLATLAYASLLILAVKAGAWRWLTGALAPVGRMAFTNYLTQSLIMTTIFWGGRGFGFFGEPSRFELLLIVLAVWALQIIWSPLWLSRFQYGPMEWVWRSLTLGRLVQISRATAH